MSCDGKKTLAQWRENIEKIVEALTKRTKAVEEKNTEQDDKLKTLEEKNVEQDKCCDDLKKKIDALTIRVGKIETETPPSGDLLFTGEILAPQNNVYDIAGTAVAGVTIYARFSNTAKINSAMTDSDGNFKINIPNDGDCTIVLYTAELGDANIITLEHTPMSQSIYVPPVITSAFVADLDYSQFVIQGTGTAGDTISLSYSFPIPYVYGTINFGVEKSYILNRVATLTTLYIIVPESGSWEYRIDRHMPEVIAGDSRIKWITDSYMHYPTIGSTIEYWSITNDLVAGGEMGNELVPSTRYEYIVPSYTSPNTIAAAMVQNEDNTLTVHGYYKPNEEVAIMLPDGSTKFAYCDANGSFEMAITTPQPSGTIRVYEATDGITNFNVTLDFVAQVVAPPPPPEKPTFTMNVSNDGANHIVSSGTATPYAEIYITFPNGDTMGTQANADGLWEGYTSTALQPSGNVVAYAMLNSVRSDDVVVAFVAVVVAFKATIYKPEPTRVITNINTPAIYREYMYYKEVSIVKPEGYRLFKEQIITTVNTNVLMESEPYYTYSDGRASYFVFYSLTTGQILAAFYKGSIVTTYPADIATQI